MASTSNCVPGHSVSASAANAPGKGPGSPSAFAARRLIRQLNQRVSRQRTRTQASPITVWEAAKAARERGGARAAQGREAEAQPPVEQRDYPPNPSDKSMLQGAPKEPIDSTDVANCFDYPRNLHERYMIRGELGGGGQGTVYRAIHKETGVHYACKSIPKVLPKFDSSTAHHLLKTRSEVDTMTQMGASLDVVGLKEVFEDDEYVHMIIELCEGGQLAHELDMPDLSEEEVAGIMRSVLRFIAQCAAKGVVYRDCKPGNFLFTETSPSSRRVKATDLGLAVQHGPDDAPLTATSGTSIYMAPEVIRKEYGTPADVYSAGVMCFKLLTKRYPYWESMRFTRKPTNKEIFSKITKEDIDFSTLKNDNLSAEVQDFLQLLLTKDPAKRPTAADALQHPWLREEEVPASGSPPALEGTLVQRLQRFAVMGHFTKVALTMVAEQLSKDESIWQEILEHCSELDGIYHQIAADDGSGVVHMAEVMAYLGKEGYGVSEPEISKLLPHMDVDNDGVVEYHEFMTCLMDWDKIATHHKDAWDSALHGVFNQMDAEGSGHISVDDIFARLPRNEAIPTHEGTAMLRDVDRDRDGVVSWEDFYGTMMLAGTAASSQGPSNSPLHVFDKRHDGTTSS